MIEPRIYRAAFVPAIVAFAVAMFSLANLPAAAPLNLAADVLFEGDSVEEAAQQIARRYPDRRPGTPGDAAVAELVAGRFQEHGFEVLLDEFTEDGRELVNVIGTRTGGAREHIVVLAARDADSIPDLAGSATDTAALVEIATALEGRAPQKTIVLASVDGSTLGDAGTRRLVESAVGGEPIEAVLLLSDLGAPPPAGPEVVAWSNDATRGPIALERTAEDALRRELGSVPVEEGVAEQFVHLAFPIGVGGQGVLLEEGIDAVRFSGSGLLPPRPEPEAIDADRAGGLGRAALQTLFALDAGGGLEASPPAYVILARNLLPQWAVSVLGLGLLLPVLVASIDAFARARRRREPVGAWASWVVARVVPLGIGLLVALVLVIAGVAPNTSGASPAPSVVPLDAGGAVALGLTAAAVAVAWIFLRPLLSRWGGAPADPAAPGAACAVALVVSLTTLAAWLMNPFGALALVPAAHLWALATLSDVPGRARTRALMVAGGLAAPAAIAVAYMLRLSLDPLEAAWYLFLLVTGGQVGLAGALVGCILIGSLGAVVEILLARRRGEETAGEGAPVVRGPGGYAGPGSLGGTESALKR